MSNKVCSISIKGFDHYILENSVLIIDEAHNLFNSITNGSKNAIKLYNQGLNIAKEKNINPLVFLNHF